MKEEAIEHLKVVTWLRFETDIPFYHFANERRCSPQQGAFLKKMGVKAGVSDLFFPRSNKSSKGLWIELKSAKGRASPAQINFMKDMRIENYECEVAYSSDEAIYFIKLFYDIN